METPSQLLLKEALNYCPDTGVFTWNRRPKRKFRTTSVSGYHKRWSGKKAGWHGRGYLYITLLGTSYPAHRLAWMYVYGKTPSCILDHVNGVKSDNRIKNLREVTYSGNCRNRKICSDNSSGFGGVSFHAKTRRWRAEIRVAGKTKHLGSFEDIEDAIDVRRRENIRCGYTDRHGAPSSNIHQEKER